MVLPKEDLSDDVSRRDAGCVRAIRLVACRVLNIIQNLWNEVLLICNKDYCTV